MHSSTSQREGPSPQLLRQQAPTNSDCSQECQLELITMATVKAINVMVVAVVAIVVTFNYEPYPCPSLLHLRGEVDREMAFEVGIRAEPLPVLILQI